MSTELNLSNEDVTVNSLTVSEILQTSGFLRGDGSSITTNIENSYLYCAKAYLQNNVILPASQGGFARVSCFPANSAGLEINTDQFECSIDGITVPDPGYYLCFVNASLFQEFNTSYNTVRRNEQVSFTINGIVQDEIGNGVITFDNLQYETSACISTIYELKAGDQIGLAFRAEAATATVNLTDSSYVVLYRIDPIQTPDYILEIETLADNEQFELPAQNNGTYDAVVHWGDGTTSDITAFDDPDLIHTYATAGTYEIRVSGTYRSQRMYSSIGNNRLKRVKQLGEMNWNSLSEAFHIFGSPKNLVSFSTGRTDINGGNLTSMFRANQNLVDVDLSGITNPTTLFRTFHVCTSLETIDLSHFDTSAVISMQETFGICNSLQDVIGIENWNIENVTNLTSFITGGKLPLERYSDLLVNWAAQTVNTGLQASFGNSQYNSVAAQTAKQTLVDTHEWVISDLGLNSNFIFTVETTTPNETFTIPCNSGGTFNATVDWGDGTTSTITAYDDADLAHVYTNPGEHRIEISGTLPNIRFGLSATDAEKVTKVIQLGAVGWTSFYEAFNLCSNLIDFKAGYSDLSGVTDMRRMFYLCDNVQSIDFSNANTSNVLYMGQMFWFCQACTNFVIQDFDTSSVSDFSQMFYECNSVTSLDLSNFNTTSAISMREMFWGCTGLLALDLSNFNTANVTDMSSMFRLCQNLTSLDISSFDTSNVTNMNAMFYFCTLLPSLDVSNFNTANVTNMANMFGECAKIITLDLLNFNTANVTNMGGMFNGMVSLISLDISSFNTTNVTSMSSMFRDILNIAQGGLNLDLTNFDFQNVTDISDLFYASSGVVSVTFPAYVDLRKATSFRNFFVNCSNLVSANLEGFVTSSALVNIQSMYQGASKIEVADLSGFDTSGVTNMQQAFFGASSLITLDISSFDTSSVTNMRNMFLNCFNITALDVSNFNTANVTDMAAMFSNCQSITTLDLSSFNTSNVVDMEQMFYRTYNLSSITFNPTTFNTSNVTDMYRMFRECNGNLSLDLSFFDTSSVTRMLEMFYRPLSPSNITVAGVENWNVTSVTNFQNFMELVTLPTTQYDALLINWSGQAVNSGLTNVDFGGSKYTAGGAAEAARTTLQTTYGWQIVDAGPA